MPSRYFATVRRAISMPVPLSTSTIRSSESASLAGSEPYTRRVLGAHPQLRVIARAGVGYDAVDVQAATEQGVAVAITPNTNQDAVAEHTFTLILALAKNLIAQHTGTVKGQWPRQANLPLRGRTLGIAGIAAMTSSQIAALTTADIVVLTTAQIAVLGANSAGLTSAQVAALSTAQVQALTTASDAALTTAAMAGLTTADIQALTTAEIATGLQPSQMAGLSAADLQALTAIYRTIIDKYFA